MKISPIRAPCSRAWRDSSGRTPSTEARPTAITPLTSCTTTEPCYFSVVVSAFPDKAWKAKAHSDGTMYGGMFIVGIDTPDGQATYHYDIDPYWGMFRCKELDRAPEWDGHTPEQAIERIGKLTGLIDRATTHLVLDEDGRTCCAKCGCDYLCMSSATYCPDYGAKVAKNG